MPPCQISDSKNVTRDSKTLAKTKKGIARSHRRKERRPTTDHRTSMTTPSPIPVSARRERSDIATVKTSTLMDIKPCVSEAQNEIACRASNATDA